MIDVIGVRFKKAGKIYYFDPDSADFAVGESVIVETARGVEFGGVVIANRSVDDAEIVSPLKKVIRKATEADVQQKEINREREREAFDIAIEKIKKHELEMKLVDVELTFDLNKIIFYFTADGRIDFRELVKDLAYVFRMRIELRQVGVRDESKFLNGIGICGRPLCCATFLDEFQPVSIKMAKEQSLSLNPTKISGICGRLMCCLKYEEETYEYLNKNMPAEGDTVKTADGAGEVLSTSVLRQTARVAVRKKPNDSPTIAHYPVDQIRVTRHKDGRKEQDFEDDLPGADEEMPDVMGKLENMLKDAAREEEMAERPQNQDDPQDKPQPKAREKAADGSDGAKRRPRENPERRLREAKPRAYHPQKEHEQRAHKPRTERPKDDKPRDEKPRDDKPERPKDDKPEKPKDEKPAEGRIAREKNTVHKPADEKPKAEKPDENASGEERKDAKEGRRRYRPRPRRTGRENEHKDQ